MKSLYVVGGRRRVLQTEQAAWRGFRKGVVLELDIETGEAQARVEYVSPPEVRADEEPAILFKAATLREGRLYVCTETEVLVYRVPGFERAGYMSLPQFNDLHHVRPNGRDNLFVANTGLDMVLQLSGAGKILRAWNVTGSDPWGRFSKRADYRKIRSTKPHIAHPNYIFQIGDEVWVTRFEQRDAICLTDPRRRIEIGGAGPHDGIVFGDEVFFTTVDGQVVVADCRSLRVRRRVDLRRIGGKMRVPGWCRGLHVLDRSRVVVGFSRFRPTENRRNLTWIQHQILRAKDYRHLPTRVALYDIRRRQLVWEHSVEDAGVNAIFSLHPVPERCERPA